MGTLTKALGRLLQVGVFNGELEEMEDTLILGTTAYMDSHLVPVISIHLKTLGGVVSNRGMVNRKAVGHTIVSTAALYIETKACLYDTSS